MTVDDGASATVLRGRVVAPDAVLEDGVVEVAGDRIVAVRTPSPADPAPTGDWLLPGLVDVHNHGGGGASFTAADPEQVAVAAAHHLAHGTTSVLASAVTDAPARMLRVVATLADAVDAGLLAGIHVEGPFLAEACRGAQDAAYLLPPDPALAAELVAAGRGHVRVMTIAAELPGAEAVAEVLAASGVVAALGHTAADAATARAFLAAGRAPLVTHLFNGMPAVHHRSPGPAMAALAAAAGGLTSVELVADGVHLDDETVRAVLDIAGEQSVLVTDAMAAAGMADGEYELGPQRVEVRGGVARIAGGGAIAGGTSRLLDQVRRHAAAGLPLVRLVRAAATRPAAVVGLSDVGALAPGLRADLVVAGADLRPLRVLRAGRWVDERVGA
ncbi:N-acetylglucosamine-6-phosphate deacetylase [Nocardioides cheoyonin]|uniref:N-acetylglucosamine-6-phosphate deacetylase n=1 Tax=Nocardioides cheoyonin TaxID=3156615 RepID=UPI0032B4FB59